MQAVYILLNEPAQGPAGKGATPIPNQPSLNKFEKKRQWHRFYPPIYLSRCQLAEANDRKLVENAAGAGVDQWQSRSSVYKICLSIPRNVERQWKYWRMHSPRYSICRTRKIKFLASFLFCLATELNRSSSTTASYLNAYLPRRGKKNSLSRTDFPRKQNTERPPHGSNTTHPGQYVVSRRMQISCTVPILLGNHITPKLSRTNQQRCKAHAYS